MLIIIAISVYYIKKYKKKKVEIPMEHNPTSFNNPIYRDIDTPIYQDGISNNDIYDNADVYGDDREQGYITLAADE